MLTRDLGTGDGAHHTVSVDDGQMDFDWSTVVDCRLCLLKDFGDVE